jgi:hypothetical protein
MLQVLYSAGISSREMLTELINIALKIIKALFYSFETIFNSYESKYKTILFAGVVTERWRPDTSLNFSLFSNPTVNKK